MFASYLTHSTDRSEFASSTGPVVRSNHKVVRSDVASAAGETRDD